MALAYSPTMAGGSGQPQACLASIGGALLLLGCSQIAGVDGLHYDLEQDAASTVGSSAAVGTGGASSTTTGATTGTGGQVSGSASTGAGGMGGANGIGGSAGDGGVVDVCGDGVIGPGEECDDQNTNADDGCDACLVVCTAPGEFEDPTTHHCYYLGTQQITWSNADAQCAARGSTLVAISSQEEQTLFAGHVPQGTKPWIGANSPVVTGDFVWSNGEPWGYTHWLANKPDNGAGSEDCVQIDENGFWDDAQCSNHRGFFCERAPPGMLP